MGGPGEALQGRRRGGTPLQATTACLRWGITNKGAVCPIRNAMLMRAVAICGRGSVWQCLQCLPAECRSPIWTLEGCKVFLKFIKVK